MMVLLTVSKLKLFNLELIFRFLKIKKASVPNKMLLTFYLKTKADILPRYHFICRFTRPLCLIPQRIRQWYALNKLLCNGRIPVTPTVANRSAISVYFSQRIALSSAYCLTPADSSLQCIPIKKTLFCSSNLFLFEKKDTTLFFCCQEFF